MINTPYVLNRANEKRESIKKDLDIIAGCIRLLTKEAGGLVSLADRRFPDAQVKTLVNVGDGMYQKMLVIGVRTNDQDDDFDIALVPTPETKNVKFNAGGQWPCWVSARKGPAIFNLTMLTLANNAWRIVEATTKSND